MATKKNLPHLRLEKKYQRLGYHTIAGVDEAGRGAWAGPIVGAAVVLQKRIVGLDDSKKLTELCRERLYKKIMAQAVAYKITIVDNNTLDRFGLAYANYYVLRESVGQIDLPCDFVLVDGFHIPDWDVPHEKIVKGDRVSQSIAAASILAKVCRDRIMIELHKEEPHYGFANHKGYGTAAHHVALKKHGVSKFHRQSYAPIQKIHQTQKELL